MASISYQLCCKQLSSGVMLNVESLKEKKLQECEWGWVSATYYISILRTISSGVLMPVLVTPSLQEASSNILRDEFSA